MKRTELIHMYPELFGKPPFDPKTSLMYFGLEVGDGWLPILEELFEKLSEKVLTHELHDFRISQVKEKFGGLRVYTRNGNEATASLIREAVEKASHTCDVCAKPGELKQIELLWATRCQRHENDN